MGAYNWRQHWQAKTRGGDEIVSVKQLECGDLSVAMWSGKSRFHNIGTVNGDGRLDEKTEDEFDLLPLTEPAQPDTLLVEAKRLRSLCEDGIGEPTCTMVEFLESIIARLESGGMQEAQQPFFWEWENTTGSQQPNMGGESTAESLRIAQARVTELENGIRKMHELFGEPFYSWQRVYQRIEELIRRRNVLAEVCLNAIGFLNGKSVMTQQRLNESLIDAVQPIVQGNETPVFKMPTPDTPESERNCKSVESRKFRIGDRVKRLNYCDWVIESERDANYVNDNSFCYTLVEAAPSEPVVPSGIDIISAERKRQVESEGWTSEHDDEHSNHEMKFAASAYLDVDENDPSSVPTAWPWERKWWKPSDDPIRNLAKAGALIAAEIDRLSRLKSKLPSEPVRRFQKGDKIRVKGDDVPTREVYAVSDSGEFLNIDGLKRPFVNAAQCTLITPADAVKASEDKHGFDRHAICGCDWASKVHGDSCPVHGGEACEVEPELIPWTSLAEVPLDAWFRLTPHAGWNRIEWVSSQEPVVQIDSCCYPVNELLEKFEYTLDPTADPVVVMPCGRVIIQELTEIANG